VEIVNLATENRFVKGKTINGYITDSVNLETSTFDEESIINSLLQGTDNENIYLVDKNKTLCVKFNPKIRNCNYLHINSLTKECIYIYYILKVHHSFKYKYH
jgi:hypothetical protein